MNISNRLTLVMNGQIKTLQKSNMKKIKLSVQQMILSKCSSLPPLERDGLGYFACLFLCT